MSADGSSEADDVRARVLTMDVQQRETFAQLCLANGIKDEDLRHPERVTQVEMVLDDFCCMETLAFFPNLKSVCLIQQDICKIDGLGNCQVLERLLLNENRIQKLEGLQNCSRLRQLFVCSNEIEEIGAGLEGLRELRTLWVAENRIGTLDGLEHAPALTDLNVARNQLTSCAGALSHTKQLQSLNLADNQVYSFHEILGLSRLRQLAELNLTDPDWGENPICSLCNYQVYILYHLPALAVLDRNRIGVEEHQAATAAFAKKRMYYNMRVKLTKRYVTDGLRFAKAQDSLRVAFLARAFEAALRVVRQGEAFELARRKNPPSAQLEASEAVELGAMAIAERTIRDIRNELADVQATFQRLIAAVQFKKQYFIQSLMLELKTMGNIRLESGSKNTPWAKHVEDLVTARFNKADFKPFGISGIKILDVVRIHNRSLSIHFDKKLERIEPSARNIEYLFFVPAADVPNDEVGIVAEDGVCSVGPDGAKRRLLLTNSLSLLEVPRLEHAAASPAGQAVRRGMKRVPGVPVDSRCVTCSGTLLLFSALLGDEVADAPAAVSLEAGHLHDQWAWDPGRGVLASLPVEGSGRHGSATHSNVEAADSSADGSAAAADGSAVVADGSASAAVDGTAADGSAATANGSATAADGSVATPKPEAKVTEREAGSNPGLPKPEARPTSVYRCRQDDTKQKVWQVSRPEFAVPEYIIEFEYVYENHVVQRLIPPRRAELGPFATIFRDYEFFAHLGVPRSADDQEAEVAESPRLPTIEHLSADHISTPGKSIMTCTEPPVLGKIQVLDLQSRGLRRIGASALESLSSLQVVLLAFNNIETLSWVPDMPTVTHLDVAFNIVEKVDGLRRIPSLQHLDLSWNKISSSGITSSLDREAPKLSTLLLAGNPCAEASQYRSTVLAVLPRLRSLDGDAIVRADGSGSPPSSIRTTELSVPMLMDRTFLGMPQNGIGELEDIRRLEACCDPVVTLLENALETTARGTHLSNAGLMLEQEWRRKAEFVDLKCLGLIDIGSFTGFTRLRCLNLSGNQLTSLTAISSCLALEELAVEDNRLTSLEGVSALSALRRLDAGSNQIANAMDIKHLSRLTQVSLADNCMYELDTFAFMHSMMELYLSNNAIEQTRSILLLKQLPKLLVFDLFGNDLCSSADYRRYTIFHLRTLKVLDGIPVTLNEQADAEAQLSGKLTTELLEEKLGSFPACYNMNSLDLSNQGLRELGCLLNDDYFPCLHELNLDGNPFTDITQVGPLSKLMVLRLGRTKIDLERGMLAAGNRDGGIASLPHLQVLDLSQSGILEMSHFERFPLVLLRILHLPGNDICRVGGISHLTHLRELILDRNKVKHFDDDSFDGLQSLRELHVEENGLKSLANLKPLPKLRALYLSINRIAEFTELEHLRQLNHVLFIHLAQNPVARKPLYRSHVIHHLPTVRAIDGKEVTEDERGKVEQHVTGNDPSKAYHFYFLGNGEMPDAGLLNVASAAPAAGAAPGVPLLPKPSFPAARNMAGHPGGFMSVLRHAPT